MAMYLFVYQAARHGTQRWNRSRYVQGTIRGDFDLELLRRGIKGRYRILPHGEHEFQQALVPLSLEEEMYGHIVAIEEPSNAVWFKLNYDQVGRGQTKYVGGWRDLDAQALQEPTVRYRDLLARMNHATQSLGTMRYAQSSLGSFANPRHPHDARLLLAQESAKSCLGVMVETQVRMENDINFLRSSMVDVQNEIRAYLKDHRM